MISFSRAKKLQFSFILWRNVFKLSIRTVDLSNVIRTDSLSNVKTYHVTSMNTTLKNILIISYDLHVKYQNKLLFEKSVWIIHVMRRNWTNRKMRSGKEEKPTEEAILREKVTSSFRRDYLYSTGDCCESFSHISQEILIAM